MRDSVARLKKFIEKAYIENESMGSPDMSAAVRDLLTDLLHLGDDDEGGFYVFDRLSSAQEVYEYELENEPSAN